MSTPNLPLRYSIQSNGTGGGTLSHICSTVSSEGGLEKTGILRSLNTGVSFITSLTTGTSYAVIGLKLKAAYNDITIILEGISVIAGSADSFRWSLQLNPTVAGTFTYVDVTNSACQSVTGTNANTVTTPGLVISSGYLTATTRQFSADLKTALTIGSTIAGVLDAFVLTVTPLTNNASVAASLDFRELL
jgi:hypothetical protein